MRSEEFVSIMDHARDCSRSELIDVEVNGVRRLLPVGQSVVELLAQLHLHRWPVAVEINGALVPAESFGQFILNDGDQVEIVTLVGGG